MRALSSAAVAVRVALLCVVCGMVKQIRPCVVVSGVVAGRGMWWCDEWLL